MKMKEVLGFLLLAAGIVGGGGGLALVTRGQSLGFIGLALAPLLLFVAYRSVQEPAT